MLDILRKKSSTFATYFVFAILIVIFAVGFGAVAPDQSCGGGAPGSFKNRDFVEVDGEMIDAVLVRTGMQLTGDDADPRRGFSDPNDRYRYQTRFAFMNLYSPFSGGTYGTDPAKISPIKLLKVVDELIETKLVSGWAREMGLGVSKAELNDALALLLSNDNFRDPKTGALEVNNYRNWVARSLETTVAGFELLVEDELLRERVIQLLVGEIGVSDAAIDQAYKLENDKVTIDYIAVDERTAASLVPVTDVEVTEWAGKNADKVQAEYDKLKASKYTTPKSWKLRGIKIDAPVPSDDPELKAGIDAARATTKTKAEAIATEVTTVLAEKKVAEATEGEPQPVFDPLAAFAMIASAKSEHESKAQGGSLAAATLEDLGGGSFGPAVAALAPDLKPLEATGLVEVPSGFWILMPESITEEKVEAFETVKQSIAKGLLQKEKVAPFVKTLADEVLAEAKKDPTKKLADVVTIVNTKYGGSDQGISASQTSFARLSRLAAGYPASSPYLIELGGRAPDLVFAAFAATAEKPLLDKVFSVGEGGKLIIARFAEAKAGEAINDEQKTELRSQLTLDRRREVYRGWYDDLLAKKLANKDVAFTSAFMEERKAAEQAFVQAGGSLPGVTLQPQAPTEGTPAPAPTPAPTPAPAPAPAP